MSAPADLETSVRTRQGHLLEVVTDTPPEVPGTEVGARWILGYAVRRPCSRCCRGSGRSSCCATWRT